jgi:hypothetical protein
MKFLSATILTFLLVIAGSPVMALNITVFEDSGFPSLQMALTNLGLAHTYRGSNDLAFIADLNSGTFDFALINQSNLTRLNDDLNDINTFVNGGGLLLVANYDVDAVSAHPLWATMGGQFQSNFSSPINPIEFRVPGHPIFNGITDLVPTHNAGDNGDFMSALANGTVLAGAPGGDPLKAIIIERNDGRTILNTFLPFDYQGDPEIIPFLENQILYISAAPEPSTVILVMTGLLGFAGLRRKFRK